MGRFHCVIALYVSKPVVGVGVVVAVVVAGVDGRNN